MAHITVRSLRKVHAAPAGPSLEVIRDLSFELEAHSFTSILGPSGCGKSTLLNLLAGVNEPTSGQVLVDGQALRDRKDVRVGFVFQEPRLLNWRTVKRNILLPLEQRRMDPARVEDLLRSTVALMGLSGYEHYYPSQLSGGMQTRVSIARALVTEPDILLMDEPFSGLDEITARRMRRELSRIWLETHKTIVFVTHDISESVFLSEHILIVTKKPCTIANRIPVDIPYPRDEGDDRLFEIEKYTVREFLKMDDEADASRKCQVASSK